MSIHVAIKRKIHEGSEDAFEHGVSEFFRESLTSEGVLGTHLLRPLPGGDPQEYGILRSFADTDSRDRFYDSELFKRWSQKAEKWTDSLAERHELSGFELWFRGKQPPEWKMGLLTWLGVWPVSTIIGDQVGPLLGASSPWLSGAVISALIVVALTWPVMPILTRLFRNWLEV